MNIKENEHKRKGKPFFGLSTNDWSTSNLFSKIDTTAIESTIALTVLPTETIVDQNRQLDRKSVV